MNFQRATSGEWSGQRGQAFLAILILMAILLLVMLGVAADYSQVWAHRQMAQGAADAACQAGAADLFLKGTDPTANTDFPGLDFSWIGTGFNCGAKPNSPPCQYASFNGYTGSNVSVTFPVGLPVPTVANPYIKVTITDPVARSLTKLVSSTTTFNVTASAGCGLNAINTPVPLVILHRTANPAISVNGSASIKVLGGPQRSIQVDSSSATAVSVGTVDLSQGGPNNSGSDFAVFGGPQNKPVGVNLGTSGNWRPGTNPFGDPFASIAQPSAPAANGAAKPVTYKTNGCPDASGCIEYSAGNYTSCSTGSIAYGANGCLVIGTGGGSNSFTTPPNRVPGPGGTYSVGNAIKPLPTANNAGGYTFQATSVVPPGHPSSTANSAIFWPQTVGATLVDGNVTWTNMGVPPSSSNTAIFDPGLYYLGDTHGLQLRAHAMVRPSTATGDGSDGTMFYFATAATLSFRANSGSESIDVYRPDGSTVNGVTSPPLKCPSGSATPSQVPATIPGNVLLGPCGKTSGIGASGQYGSPDGNRGFLFFQNRAVAANGGSCTAGFGGNCAILGGGAGFIFSGFIYLHEGNGGTCGTNTSCLSLAGGSGGNSFTIGNIVVDQLSLTGSSAVTMILNSLATFSVLRPTLLQ